MKQHGKSLAGLLAASLLALAPVCAQTPQGTGQDKSQDSRRQGTQPTPNSPAIATQRDSGQEKAETKGREAGERTGSANRLGMDSTFVNKAAAGGLAEVKLGQLATEKASNNDVKTFGQKMVDDHGKANNELKDLAGKKNITLPTDLDAKHQSTYDRLSKLSGAEFDRAYMQEMMTDHRQDVNEFRRESKSGTDPEIKAFAAKWLPTLEEHLRQAESTSAKVKK